MKKIIVIVGVVFLFLGCQKKTKELKEMQEPLSPEISSLISNATNTSNATLSTSNIQPESPIVLPPPGPYKPTNKQIQTALKNAGFYNGAIDGVIGPKTTKAIKEFQTKNNLEVDGKIGPKTWAILSRYLNTTDNTLLP